MRYLLGAIAGIVVGYFAVRFSLCLLKWTIRNS